MAYIDNVNLGGTVYSLQSAIKQKDGAIDFNTITEPGNYWIGIQTSVSSNYPTTLNGFLFVSRRENDGIIQLYVSRPDGALYTRGYRDSIGAWSPWKQMISDADMAFTQDGSTGWSYRKLSGNLYELIYKGSGTVDTTNQALGMYFGRIGGEAYPFAITPINVQYSVFGASTQNFLIGAADTSTYYFGTTNAPTIAIYRADQRTVSYAIEWRIIGIKL